MFKILLATDGSSGSTKAAEYAARLAGMTPESEVTVIYVKELGFQHVDFAGEPGMAVVPNVADMQERIEQAAVSALNETEAALEKAGVKGILRAEWGHAADVICNVAEEGNFDTIVMGKRGLGQITGLLLGSVSDRVVHRCKVPVVTVHE